MPLGSAPASFDVVARLGVVGVQLDASDASLRPRELGVSAQRDVQASLRRRGLCASGIDCFIPMERLTDPSQVEHCLEVVRGCLVLAECLDRVPVCMCLPEQGADEIVAAILHEAARRGVPLADFSSWRAGADSRQAGIDPAAVLAKKSDPSKAVMEAAGHLAAARIVDLFTNGMRGPIGDPDGARLDALSYRVALDVAGFQGLPVIDCREWSHAASQVPLCIARWNALLPTRAGDQAA